MDTKWDFLRIATFYGIIWIALFFAFLVYCLAFGKVWRQRHELHGLFNPLNEDPFTGTITTEIEIVRTSRHHLDTTNTNSHTDTEASPTLPVPGSEEHNQEGFDPYTVNIGVGPQEDLDRHPSRPELFRLGSLTRNAALSETNPDAWLYARVAFLYFLALLLSWIPSSINRVYSLVHPNALNFGLNYTETLVFPLQGFWNAIVYIISSQTACRNLWRSMVGKSAIPRRNVHTGGLDSSEAATKWDTRSDSFGKNGGDVLGGASSAGGKLDRFSSRKAGQRWETDATSVTSLTAAHYR